MINILARPSPNFNERDPAVPLRLIVLHYTGMENGAAALQRLCDAAAEVSAHYMIEEDGRVLQLVDESQRAWHAGVSSWFGVTDMNSASIGIELVNKGHQHGYHAFPMAQITVLKTLMREVSARHKLSLQTAPVGHADIAPGRKSDPGELFPWEELAQEGLGIWPVPEPSDYGHADDAEVQALLRAAGYHCPPTAAYDRVTHAALIAFQRHYHPTNLTGTPEPETIARLRALTRTLTLQPSGI